MINFDGRAVLLALENHSYPSKILLDSDIAFKIPEKTTTMCTCCGSRDIREWGGRQNALKQRLNVLSSAQNLRVEYLILRYVSKAWERSEGNAKPKKMLKASYKPLSWPGQTYWKWMDFWIVTRSSVI